MAQSDFDPKPFEKDEYEMELYGFSLNKFKDENFHIMNQYIEKSMKHMCDIFVGMVNKIKPDMKDKITEMTNEIAKNIEESCEENIKQCVNAKIDELLSIPNNVLLPKDKVHSNSLATEEELEDLEKNCNELVKAVEENAFFISCLEKEWNSYAVKDVLKYEAQVIENAEEYLSLPVDIDLYLETLKKSAAITE